MVDSQGQYVVVAKITTVYGVKGWVKVHSFTDPIENFLDFERCYFQRSGQWQTLDIEQSQRHGKGLVAKIRGAEDRDQARQYCGLELAVPIADLPELESGDYYWHQLIGLKVIHKSGALWGEVADLMETGANDVLVVKPCKGSLDNRERLIPYLPGQVVQRVDIAAGEIVVDWDPEF